MMKAAPTQRQRGVSLIEALVAMAVMAFGILGVVGVQVSLRMNADVSKQRAEGVRIAQESVETARAFVSVTPGDGQVQYTGIVDSTTTVTSPSGANTTFTVTRKVSDAQSTTPPGPRMRGLLVDVSWPDRNGNTQKVRLSTNIAGVAPELAGSLAVSADGAPTQQPGGTRSPVIPVGAVDQGNGTSTYSPPGSGGVIWTFSNTTGVITRICSPSCVDGISLLLSGFVSFAPGSTNADVEAVQAENPTGSVLPVSLLVHLTNGTDSSCFHEDVSGPAVAYYCAVPVTSARWSGRTKFTMTSIATGTGEPSASLLRVCRYTPVQGDFPPNGNIDHPLDYVNVTAALTNQNFLIIPAGDGTTAFACPGDDLSTPFFNGNTWQHQPHS